MQFRQEQVVLAVSSLPRMPEFGDASPQRTWKLLQSMEENAVDDNAGEQSHQVSNYDPVGIGDDQAQSNEVDQMVCNDLRCLDMPFTMDEETLMNGQSKNSAYHTVDQDRSHDER